MNKTADLKQLKYDIENIVSGRAFRAIEALKESASMFRLLGVVQSELPHSNLLANLLDPKGPHSYGSYLLEELLFEIHNMSAFLGATPNFRQILQMSASDVQISREKLHIDIILDFKKAKSVIAIENKLYAGEQDKQIARYQESLANFFSDYNYRALIYLTPAGKQPETVNDKNTRTNVLIASYKSIDNIVKTAMENFDGHNKNLLEQIHTHLKEDVVGDKELIDLCRDIFAKYPRAYYQLYENYPSLGLIKDDYFTYVKDGLRAKGINSKILNWYYPLQDSRLTTELSVRNDTWKMSSAEIKLYYEPDISPLKLFITAAIEKKEALKYKDYLIDKFGNEPFEIASGWYWWCFSANGVQSLDNEDAFGELITKKAAEVCIKLFLDINDRLL